MSVQSTKGPGQSGAVIKQFPAVREKGNSSTTPPAERADSAGITESARELSRAKEAVEASRDVRAEKVKALKAAIENGTYAPDPEEIARKLLDRGI